MQSEADGTEPPFTLRGVSLTRGHWFYLSYSVQSEFMLSLIKRLQYINLLEILAAVVVYYSLHRQLYGRQVIHLIDNTSALASLIKGYSSAADSSTLVHAFWSLFLFIEVDVWFEYIRSAANIAD